MAYSQQGPQYNLKVKWLLVKKFNMILDNKDRLALDNKDRFVLNDQGITSPHTEPQRSPGFVQKQSSEEFCKRISQISQEYIVLQSLINNVADFQEIL